MKHICMVQAELLLECLEVGGEYRAAELESKKNDRKPPPPPAIMAAFNCTSADDYLLEVISRIKARFGFVNDMFIYL